MRIVRLHARGGPESPRFGDAPTPRPGAAEVLVRVHAAAVTPTELLWVPTRTTRAGRPRPLPFIPGHEFSGEVTALGEGATAVGVGEPVCGMDDWFGDGAPAEYCPARAADVARNPASVDRARAAVTPISALTARRWLIDRAQIAAGQHVLIHGAAGGVGGFAVQLARWRGARVTATAGAGNLDFVRGLGADDVIDYRWDVSPFPFEAKHEKMPTFERNDGGFWPRFAHGPQESKSRAERQLWRRW
jgi:NADPH:quinone reductase-like Zn-dependent oxidoreductase